MKNLLACFANCRYNTRCDDLRNELIDKTEQATLDINKYLSERGSSPVTIQILKRGLKFPSASLSATSAKHNDKPKSEAKMKRPPQPNARARTRRPEARLETKLRKPIVMAKKVKRTENQIATSKEETSNAASNGQGTNQSNTAKAKRTATPRKSKGISPASSSVKQGKTFIILEGKSATLVDEQALTKHMLSGTSPKARYFEASEVEARIQIVHKK